MTQYFNFTFLENFLVGVVIIQDNGKYSIVVHDEKEIVDSWEIEKGLENVVSLLYHLKEMGFCGTQERIILH